MAKTPGDAEIDRRLLLTSGLGCSLFKAPSRSDGAAAPLPPGALLVVGLFSALPRTRIPSDVSRIRTTGFRQDGVGAAYYRPVAGGPETTYRRRSADGRWWRLDELTPNVQQVGAWLDGEHDDTQAFLDAKDALPQGAGVVLAPPGVARLNLVIDFSGVTFRGSGHGKSTGSGPPETNYWRAADPRRPVVQFATDKAVVEGSFIEDVCLFGCGEDQYGLRMAGGSRLNGARRFTVAGFTVANLACRGGVAQICSNNRFSDFNLNASEPGSVAIELYDPVSSDTQFCNDQQFENGYIGATGGAKALVNDSSWANFVNVKFDVGEGAAHFRSTVAPARIFGAGDTQFDAVKTDIAILVEGRNLVDSTAGFANPIEHIRLDGRMMGSNARTTGSVALNSDILRVADPAGFSAGRSVLVLARDRHFGAVIRAVRGADVQLSRPAPVAVADAEIHVGDLAEASRPGAGLRAFDPDGSRYGAPASQPVLRGTNGSGPAGTPYGAHNPVWELGGKPLWLLCETQSGVKVKSVSRAGQTLTIEVPFGSAAVGDFVVLRGANEDGVNEEILPVTAVSEERIIARSSSAAPDVALASGDVRIWLIKPLRFHRGVPIHPRDTGLTVNTAFGDATLLSWKDVGRLHVADTAEGRFVVDFGDRLAGQGAEVFTIAQQGKPHARALSLNGGGGLSLASGPNPFPKPSLMLPDSGRDPDMTVGAAILLYGKAGVPKIKAGASPPATLTTKVEPPASSTAPGQPGQWAVDQTHLYVCVADGVWRRTPLESW